jgi:cytosine/uracil/thiamine/allantoin permease
MEKITDYQIIAAACIAFAFIIMWIYLKLPNKKK